MLLTKAEQTELLQLAGKSIELGLITGKPLQINPADYHGLMIEPRATFVTLEIQKNLRGCIGVLKPIRPLVEDVVENAYSAAFSDRRFPPLTKPELLKLELHISVLSIAEPVNFESEADLIKQLRPEIDGLILEEGFKRATFLPSVWESLPTPTQFLRHLKQKAGLSMDYWSNTIKIFRYTVDYFGGINS